jgi:hypothetical protein
VCASVYKFMFHIKEGIFFEHEQLTGSKEHACVCVLWQLFLFRSHATARVGSLTRAFFTTLKPSSGSPHRTANVPINFSRLVSFATEPYRGVSHLERFAVAFHLQHVAEEKCSKLAKISKNIPRKNYENRVKLKRSDSGLSRDIKSFAEFGMWSN